MVGFIGAGGRLWRPCDGFGSVSDATRVCMAFVLRRIACPLGLRVFLLGGVGRFAVLFGLIDSVGRSILGAGGRSRRPCGGSGLMFKVTRVRTAFVWRREWRCMAAWVTCLLRWRRCAFHRIVRPSGVGRSIHFPLIPHDDVSLLWRRG